MGKITRNGTGDELVVLLKSESRTDAEYYRILSECCDLGTFEIYPVAFAVLPHLERIAAELDDPKASQWPLSISAAICANYKTAKEKPNIPKELADNFFAAVKRAAETTAKNIQRFPTEDPSFTKFMMIQPVFENIEKQPLFGNPQPNSFVLYDWFEQHRPKNGG